MIFWYLLCLYIFNQIVLKRLFFIILGSDRQDCSAFSPSPLLHQQPLHFCVPIFPLQDIWIFAGPEEEV